MAVEDIKSDSGFETATKGCKESAHLHAYLLILTLSGFEILYDAGLRIRNWLDLKLFAQICR